jgi:hypothetical protein
MPERFHQQHSDLHAWWLRARKDVEGTARIGLKICHFMVEVTFLSHTRARFFGRP